MLYLYGFTSPEGEPPPEELTGVGECPIEVLDLGPISAVVSTVDDEEFAPDRIESRLHDLDWLGEQGALHERVVTWFVDHAAILPARFLTLHSDQASLRASLEERMDAVTRRFRELEGHREWNLKVTFRPGTVREHLAELSDRVAALDGEMEQVGPGRRYLLQQRRENLVRDEVQEVVRTRALDVYRELELLAEEGRRLSPPRGSDPGGTVALNAAFLVTLDSEAALRDRGEALKEELDRMGMHLDLTGPWAPYRFVERSEDHDAEMEREEPGSTGKERNGGTT